MATIAASVEIFREFAKRYGIAVRSMENARAQHHRNDRTEAALSQMQALEAEFNRSFRLIGQPDWQRVDAIARGDV